MNYAEDFFGEKTSLTVSGQLEGEVFAMALEIYTFGPTFRAENSNTSRHLAEFWMVEPEMAFYELVDDMDLAEEFLQYLFKDVLENCPEDLAFFDERIHPGLLDGHRLIAETAFERVDYTRAVEILEKSNQNFSYRPEWGCNLQSEHEHYLSEHVFKKPVILFDYPEDQTVLYEIQRGWENGSRDGCSPAQAGRDHRRFAEGRRLRCFVESNEREKSEYRRILLVSGFASIWLGAAFRIWIGFRTSGAVCHRDGQYPRRDSLPAHAEECKILVRAYGEGEMEHGALADLGIVPEFSLMRVLDNVLAG